MRLYDLLFARAATKGGGGGGGFTPTQEQLDAMNSGITEEGLETIENNISKQQDTTAQGGNGYAIINGGRVYFSDTAPTGTIPIGSIWIGG